MFSTEEYNLLQISVTSFHVLKLWMEQWNLTLNKRGGEKAVKNEQLLFIYMKFMIKSNNLFWFKYKSAQNEGTCYSIVSGNWTFI